jgi:hypothetical protein
MLQGRMQRSGTGRRWSDVEFREVAVGCFACDNLK